MIVSLLVQWESGRTPHNPLHAIRSKAKGGPLRHSFFRASCPRVFLRHCIPTVDNLRNFFLTPTAEVLSFFQQLREAPQMCTHANREAFAACAPTSAACNCETPQWTIFATFSDANDRLLSFFQVGGSL